MKNPTSWYTRGSRPDRNAQAALFAGVQGFLDALVNGKPRPWLYAVTRATFAATAMNEHRLAARANANARSSAYADLSAEALNKLLDLSRTPPLPPATSPLLGAIAGAPNPKLSNR